MKIQGGSPSEVRGSEFQGLLGMWLFPEAGPVIVLGTGMTSDTNSLAAILPELGRDAGLPESIEMACNVATDWPKIALGQTMHIEMGRHENWLDSALQRLSLFALLQPNWDSYGAQSISPSAIEAATALMRTLAENIGEDASPFLVAPLANGGVQLEWEGEDGTLEVEIEPDDTVNALVIRGADPERAFEELSGIRSEDVSNLLRSIRHLAA